MKKANPIVSPFMMLLIPIILVIGLLVLHVNKEIPPEKYNACINLQVPTFKILVQSLFF